MRTGQIARAARLSPKFLEVILLELRKAQVAICGLLLVDGLTEPQPPLSGGHIEATPKPR